MSNFTKADFNTIMNYLEYELSMLGEYRRSGEMTPDKCKQYYSHLTYVRSHAEGNFNAGLFKDE